CRRSDRFATADALYHAGHLSVLGSIHRQAARTEGRSNRGLAGRRIVRATIELSTVLGSEHSGSERDALQRATSAGSIREGSLELFRGEAWLLLLQQQVTELLPRRNNRTRRHRKLLDGVLLIGSLAQQSDGVRSLVIR